MNLGCTERNSPALGNIYNAENPNMGLSMRDFAYMEENLSERENENEKVLDIYVLYNIVDTFVGLLKK